MGRLAGTVSETFSANIAIFRRDMTVIRLTMGMAVTVFMVGVRMVMSASAGIMVVRMFHVNKTNLKLPTKREM